MHEQKSWWTTLIAALVLVLVLGGCAAAPVGKGYSERYQWDTVTDDPEGWGLYMNSQGGG